MSVSELTVEIDNTVSGKWANVSQVTARNLGACSVAAIYNKHGFVISSISAGENREKPAAANLCSEYNRLKSSVFGNEAAMLWILYEEINAVAGPTIKPAMMAIQPVKTSVQIYDGESFMEKTNEAGARFSLAFSAGVARASLHIHDGKGGAIALLGTGTIVRCP